MFIGYFAVGSGAKRFVMRLPLILSILLGIGALLPLHPAAGQNPVDPALPTQLTVTDQQAGTGRELRAGMYAVVHYTGWVYDPAAAGGKGKQFVNSRERGEPLSFLYGYQRAVRGLERGMEGMKVGGKRTIVIPPKLGYDGLKHPNPPEVPKGSALVFEVELLEAVPQSAPPDG